MIGIRVDGNNKIGMGHISRCLSIASALRNRNVKFMFICSKDTPINNIEECGYSVIVVQGSSFDNWSSKEEIECIRENRISVLLVDSYYVSEKMLHELHNVTKLIYLDDLQQYDYDTDVIINYNIEATAESYADTIYSFRKAYLGISYFPLKESLIHINSEKINENVTNVLITTGGTDPFHCIHRILSAIKIDKYCDIKFNVIIGLFFEEKYKKMLYEYYHKFDNIRFLEWGQDMAKIYGESDIVIAPGSTTVYEALSMGVPCISFQFADNQYMECVMLDKYELVPFAGDYSQEIDEKIIGELFDKELFYEVRKKQFDRFVGLFDGNGSNRIADIIIGVENEDKI